jgi:hypothetical protein
MSGELTGGLLERIWRICGSRKRRGLLKTAGSGNCWWESKNNEGRRRM